MAANKKVNDITDEKIVGGNIGLSEVRVIVNSVVDNSFQQRNGVEEFSAEYFEVLKAYWKLCFFFPALELTEIDIFEFFDKYIVGEYDGYLEKIAGNRTVEYIDKAIDSKIKFKVEQVKNPLINSMTNMCDAVSFVVNKYKDSIDGEDFKQMIGDFKKYIKTTNTETIVNTVLNKRRKDTSKRGKSV